FEAFADERQRLLEIDALRDRLGLAPLPAADLGADKPAVGLSNFDLERLDLPSLSDDQLIELIERIRMCSHSRLLYAGLKEWVGREHPGEAAETPNALQPANVFNLLASLAAVFGRTQEALEWITRGRSAESADGDDRFEKSLMSKLQELRIRAASGTPDELRPLLLDLWENYGAKLPNLREQLRELTTQLQMDPPWESAIVTAGAGWTPGQATESAESPKKLWIPGQD
ncbi:MAG: hypothetical protein KDA75_22075, partial [Planctomycetaceae bacterium]|nr:hypothetical protein [Planctomycetaceae bacterium]